MFLLLRHSDKIEKLRHYVCSMNSHEHDFKIGMRVVLELIIILVGGCTKS